MSYLRIPPDTTYFHVTHGKAGSQWMRGILEDVFGPAVIPAEYHARQVFGKPIYSEKIYTCVYLGEPEFDTLKIPGQDRRLVIIRDLRDTLISMYFSVRYSHALEVPSMETERHILTNLSEEDKSQRRGWDQLFDGDSASTNRACAALLASVERELLSTGGSYESRFRAPEENVGNRF
jgi:hypothetical protein